MSAADNQFIPPVTALEVVQRAEDAVYKRHYSRPNPPASPQAEVGDADSLSVSDDLAEGKSPLSKLLS